MGYEFGLRLLNFTRFRLGNTCAVIEDHDEFNMPLGKYEDFLDLSIKDLTNYLSVRGLNTSGIKVELVPRAFPAFELKMNK